MPSAPHIWRALLGLALLVTGCDLYYDTDAVSLGSPADGCERLTCDALDAQCGGVADGCGGRLECGGCAPGFTCGGGGVPNRCGEGVCPPVTCEVFGDLCGELSNGCDDVLDCGPCPEGQSCGGGGPNRCGAEACVPMSCEALGWACGSGVDNCGEPIRCGSCPDGEVCGGDGTPHRCAAPSCVPETCEALGAECGMVANRCGSFTTCPACPDGQTCGGGGPNRCGEDVCVPPSCEDLGYGCGTHADGCSAQLECGACGEGQVCVPSGQGYACARLAAHLVPDSADVPCLDAGGATVECPPQGEALWGQDGSFSIYPPVYDLRPETVVDRVTGLMWQRHTPPTLIDCDALVLAGFDDWRTPTVPELYTLVQVGRIPAIDPIAFLDHTSAAYATAPIPRGDGTFRAYSLSFRIGEVDTGAAQRTRCVRGGAPWERPSLEVQGDAALDAVTGLMWDRRAPPVLEPMAAIAHCAALDLGGHRDWRVPTIKELYALADLTRAEAPRIDVDVFPSHTGGFLLSLSPWPRGSSSGWLLLDLRDGQTFTGGASSSGAVTCVRNELPCRLDPNTGRCADLTRCTPATCSELGATCGEVEDGCEVTLDCGGCPESEMCGYGGGPNTCGPSLRPMPDSATVLCLDATDAAAACPASGQAGYGQDGNYRLYVPTWTTTDATATDSVTGLTWTRQTQAASGTTSPEAVCDALLLDGFADWRLPSIVELVSIVDMGREACHDPDVFGRLDYTDLLSADRPEGQAPYRWGLTIGGSCGVSRLTNGTFLCVRGPRPLPRFETTDASVTDLTTGLTFERHPPASTHTWFDALRRCEQLNLDGHDDWRLVSFKELSSLLDPAHPPFDPALFPDRPTAATFYWTSTPNVMSTGEVDIKPIQTVDGISGNVGAGSGNRFQSWCVR